MRRKVHFWPGRRTIDFHPAPAGQSDHDISVWMNKKKFERLPTIDDDAAVERYVKAYQEFLAAHAEICEKLD